jgi:hypothetical protein
MKASDIIPHRSDLVRQSKEEKIAEYLSGIKTCIECGFNTGCGTVYCDVNESLYSSKKLKEELKELGYQVSIEREFDDYANQKLPIRIVINLNNA